MIKADLHVHTKYSDDSNTQYDQLIEACQHKGINCVAIADHGTTKGARELSKFAPFKIIVCEEVLTPYGEIMGMFLQEDIPNNIQVNDAIQIIRQQGGLVCLPHPYDRIRPSAICDSEILESIISLIDIIEIFNARSLFPGAEKKARNLALAYNKAVSAGSDAHSPIEIGDTYVEMQDFKSKDEFLAALRGGKLHCKKSSPLIHLISTTARLCKYSKIR